MKSIVDELRELISGDVTDREHACSAADVSALVCRLLDQTVLHDDGENDKLAIWAEQICELRCTLLSEHLWCYDHCGYWGHQYCSGCGRHKYPELGELSCSKAIAKIGQITEADYLQSR